MNEHDVQIVVFPATGVAAIEHRGPPSMGDFPIFFHHVNVWGDVREDEMITDVYLPVMDKNCGVKESPKRSTRP